MTRLMYDTTDVPALSIPTDAQIVAGYIDGHYRSFDAVVARCPNAVHVPIAVFPSTNGGQVLDCETGDATPAQCPAWVKMRRAAGVFRPTVYTLASWVGDVKRFCAQAGLVFNVEWDLWVAHYDGWARPDGYGEIAKQFVNHGPHGENCDISAVFDDDWPHTSTTPTPPKPRPRLLEEAMSLEPLKRRTDDKGQPVSYTEDGHTFPYIYDAPGDVDGTKKGDGVKLDVNLIVGPSDPANDGTVVDIWSGVAGQTHKRVNLSAYYNFFPVSGAGRQSVVSDSPLDGWVRTLVVPG